MTIPRDWCRLVPTPKKGSNDTEGERQQNNNFVASEPDTLCGPVRAQAGKSRNPANGSGAALRQMFFRRSRTQQNNICFVAFARFERLPGIVFPSPWPGGSHRETPRSRDDFWGFSVRRGHPWGWSVAMHTRASLARCSISDCATDVNPQAWNFWSRETRPGDRTKSS